MHAHVGNGFQPLPGGRAYGAEVQDVQTAQEILFHIAHGILNAPFFISLAHAAGHNLEPEVVGKVHVTKIIDRSLADHTSDDGAFQIIDHDFSRNRTEKMKSILMTGKEMLHASRDGELHVHHSAVTQNHDKEAETTAR